MLNSKDKRIIKLWLNGTSVDSICNKIGQPGDIQRVNDAIRRFKQWECIPCRTMNDAERFRCSNCDTDRGMNHD